MIINAQAVTVTEATRAVPRPETQARRRLRPAPRNAGGLSGSRVRAPGVKTASADRLGRRNGPPGHAWLRVQCLRRRSRVALGRRPDTEFAWTNRPGVGRRDERRFANTVRAGQRPKRGCSANLPTEHTNRPRPSRAGDCRCGGS